LPLIHSGCINDRTRDQIPGLFFMSFENSGDVCGCPMDPSPTETVSDLAVAAARMPEPQAIAEERSDAEADAGAWRGELADRLNRYRARRKAPPPRYPSLKLPFETIEFPSRSAPAESLLATFEASSNQALALDGICPQASVQASPEEHVVPAPIHAPLPHASAKIIEFPRFAWGPPSPPPDQLAEPVCEKPRILDVPDAMPPAPALGGITIEPLQIAETEKRPGIDIPVQSAPLGRRLVAACVDGLILAIASALFGLVFWKVAAVRPPQLQLLSFGAGILCCFWAAYEYLLIVYSATTPGLQVAGLELTGFDGTSTSRSRRRWRVLASYLSALSLGMGYVWVFLDEDALCWHDRITHTYLARGKRETRKESRQ
jgi:hypothetical protein